MIVLGIKCIGHDTGAAIVGEKDGKLVTYAIAEARLNRYKHSYQFPLLSIQYCLEAFGLTSLDQVDFIGMDVHVDQMSQPQVILNKNPEDYAFDQNDRRNFSLFHSLNYPKDKIFRVNHVDAHAASAYFVSPFENATALIVDGGLGIYSCRNGEIECIDRVGYVDSIQDRQNIEHQWFPNTGRLFEEVTEYLGYKDGGFSAGKTMGLAAYGDTVEKENPINIIDDRETNTFINYMNTFSWMQENLDKFSPEDHPNGNDGLVDPKWINLARQAQDVLIEDMKFLAAHALVKGKSKNLCLAGGVALSCVANRAIRDMGLFNDIFIQPASSDEGIPLGVALMTYYENGGKMRSPMKNAYLGRPNPQERLPSLLDSTGLEYRKTTNVEVAKLVAEGKVIGRCYGGSEYGPRALGNRSIIADPRSKVMRDYVNESIKHREGYRPFAPSCLAEYGNEYFDLDFDAPFMIIAAQVRDEWQDKLPAITHVDGSSRPQTVHQEQNPDYYDFIKAFGDLTGVYCVLNTSFNDNGEPIVESYEDAIRGMFRTGVDYLHIDGYLVVRPEETESVNTTAFEIGETVRNKYTEVAAKLVDPNKYERLAQRLGAPMNCFDEYVQPSSKDDSCDSFEFEGINRAAG